MPDFTYHNATCCESARSFDTTVVSTSSKRIYVVSYGPTPRGPYEYGWSCTCTGFQVRKTCAHVTSVEKLPFDQGGRCGWDSEADGGEATDGKCPQCSSPVTHYQYGA